VKKLEVDFRGEIRGLRVAALGLSAGNFRMAMQQKSNLGVFLKYEVLYFLYYTQRNIYLTIRCILFAVTV
jgi:hypothetical protein